MNPAQELSQQEWHDQRILILGMTYPHYSRKFTENACTGGLRDDNLGMMRIYPVPHRYLEAGNKFHAFQWIRVKVKKNTSDPRPESYLVQPDSIYPELMVKDHLERRKLVESSPHMCESIEDIKKRWATTGMSLGIIKPKSVDDVRLRRKSESDRAEWAESEREAFRQLVLFERHLKPIDFPEVDFEVSFTCNDKECDGHTMHILQWGLHELYRKFRREPDGSQKVIDQMKRMLDQSVYDLYFFVGNFRGKMFNFGLMDTWSAKKTEFTQESLFQ